MLIEAIWDTIIDFSQLALVAKEDILRPSSPVEDHRANNENESSGQVTDRVGGNPDIELGEELTRASRECDSYEETQRCNQGECLAAGCKSGNADNQRYGQEVGKLTGKTQLIRSQEHEDAD